MKAEEKADLAILNADIVDVCTKEIVRNSVAVKSDRIIRVGEIKDLIAPSTSTVDARGMYLCPGFIDSHLHIESSSLTLTEFAKVTLIHGTTTLVIDPHEITNVLGMEGVKILLKESEDLPLDVYLTAPSCVPAALGFETSGAELTAKEIRELLRMPKVIALGEVMDFPAVLRRDPSMMEKIAIAHSLGKRVDGHAPTLRGKTLCDYVSAGIHSDHECLSGEEALERLRLGMWIMAREGSTSKNLRRIVRFLREARVDVRHVMLVTDDLSPRDIIKSHMNALVRAVIEEGYDPITAIQMATINPASYFGLDSEIGFIAPGMKANMALIGNLEKMDVKMTIARGKVVTEDGKLVSEIRKWTYPREARETVRVKRMPRPSDFAIAAEGREAEVRIIEVRDASVLTKHNTARLPIAKGKIVPDPKRDILQAAVVERHKATGNVGLGFVRGFGLRRGAIASSIAHDSHNIVVIGATWDEMALAVEEVVRMKGGLVITDGRSVLGSLALPIAGLLSDESARSVSEKLERLRNAAKRLGCMLREPFMTLSFIALPVIPELKLTDKGLIQYDPKLRKLRFVDPIVEVMREILTK